MSVSVYVYVLSQCIVKFLCLSVCLLSVIPAKLMFCLISLSVGKILCRNCRKFCLQIPLNDLFIVILDSMV